MALRERPSLGLKELATRHVDPEASRCEQAIAAFREGCARRTGIKRDDVTYDLVPVDLMVPYAASDTRWTLALFELLRAFADERTLRLYETERALIPVLADMEYRGARVDRGFLHAAEREHAERVRAARAAVYRMIGRDDLDLDSLPRLVELFRQARVKLGAPTTTGRPSLTKGTLEALARKHPLARAVADYRKAAKLKGTYVWIGPHARSLTGPRKGSRGSAPVRGFPRADLHP